MKNLILTLFLATTLTSCTSNDNTLNIPTIEGSTFTRSSYIIETPVDANGDGVFSTDLMEENFCFELNLGFNEETTTSIPTNDMFLLDVTDDGNGNMTQSLRCGHGDGPGMQYSMIEENIVYFYYSDNLNFTGILSDDGNTITIDLENRFLYGFNFFTASNKILNQDGSITEYNGDAIVTYTRQ